jgi:hypothetical protein
VTDNDGTVRIKIYDSPPAMAWPPGVMDSSRLKPFASYGVPSLGSLSAEGKAQKTWAALKSRRPVALRLNRTFLLVGALPFSLFPLDHRSMQTRAG